MRVPTTPPQSNNNVKSVPGSNISFLGIPSYEPTSVLDLRRSPSHNDPADWDDNMLHNLDWDSLMTDLALPEDDSSKTGLTLSDPFASSDFNLYAYPTHNHPGSGFDFGSDFIEELIRAADCFDSNELQLAQVVLARLNNRLRAPSGKPLQRAAFYFKEALQSLLSGSNRAARPSSWSDVVQSIKAYKAFSALSPIPMFSHFTANQALLEALDGSVFVHVIDFDIGFGGQYASFMKELAHTCNLNSPVLRISAVVPDEFATEIRLVKDNLSQFAQDLNIGFQIDLVPFRTFEMLSFKAVNFMEGEKTAVHLSPAIFTRLGSAASIGAFLGDVRRVSPCVVVFVDGEGWMESGATSFRRNLVSSLEFYSMMFESLDGAVGGGDWNRKIEMLLLRPKIAAAVERRVAPPWREVFQGAGMRPVHLSQFADFQAECLLGKVRVRGFHVAKRQAELMLCWHERALVATSAWRC